MSFSGSSRANRLLQSARTVPVSVRTVIAPPVSVVDPIVQSESYVDPDRVMQPLPERLVSILDGDARVREAAVAAADAARRIETDRKERLSQRRRELLALKSAEQRSNANRRWKASMAERAYLSPAEMDAAESQDFREFNPIPSSGVLERISAECVRLLHAPERICAVCGEFVQILDAADVKTVRRDQLPKETARLLSCDNPRTNWSDELKRQYCAHSTLADMMLSPDGVKVNGNDSREPPLISVCPTCWRSLSQSKLPKCAVANNFAIGRLPAEFDDTTWMEYALLTPVHRISYIVYYKKVNGVRIPNGQASLLGHVFSQRLDNAEVFEKLPLKSADVKIRVLISASYTSEQKRLTLKPYAVRQERVNALFEWFKTHHPTLYGGITLDEAALRAIPVRGVMPGVVESTEEVVQAVSGSNELKVPPIPPLDSTSAAASSSSLAAASSSSSSAAAAAAAAAPAEEEPVAMSNSIYVPRPNLSYQSTVVKLRSLIDESSKNAKSGEPAPSAVHVASASASSSSAAASSAGSAVPPPGGDAVPPPGRTGASNAKRSASYDILTSSEPYWITDKPWLVKSFIHIFPFGRGGLDEQREVKISPASVVEHYQRLASRLCQRPDFVLHVFDMLSRMRMGADTFIKAKMHIRRSSDEKDNTNSFGSISVETLQAAASHIRAKAAASSAGRVPPVPPVGLDPAGTHLLNTIQQVAAACEHTPEYAQRMRARIFGYSSFLGAATWWYASHLLHACVAVRRVMPTVNHFDVRSRVHVIRLTISTEDVTSVKIHELAHGVRPESLPAVDIRFKTLADHPGAAALNFERLQSVVIKYVIGWDIQKRRPYRHVIDQQSNTKGRDEGGMLGRCRAWVLVNETQARGSLHMHILVWSVGCMNLMQRMNEIVRSFNVPDMGMSVNPPSSVGTGVSANMLEMLNAAALHPLSETPQPPSPPLRSGDHLDHKHADPNAKRPEVRSVSELAGAIERMAVSPANPPLCSSSSSAAAAAASPPAAAAAVPPIAAAVPPPAAAVPPSAAAAVPDTRSISAEHRSVELKMAEFLDSAYTAELSVGEMLKAEMHVCPQPNCGGELVTSSTAVLNQLRRREMSHGLQPIQCNRCKQFVDPAVRMVNVLNRALAEETKNDVHNLFEEDSKWSRRNRPIDELKWLIQSSGEWSRDPKLKQLYVAVMQYHCQRHVHKPSCFKKNSGKAVECRYHFPLRPAVQSAIQFDTGWSVQPKLSVRRRPVFAFLVQHMPAILSFVLSNTNLQYVANQLLTYYITCYQTKNSRDEAEAAQSVIHAFLQHIARRWGVENITHAKDRPDSKNDRKGSDWSDAKVRPDSKSDQKDNDCGNAKVDIKHPFAVGAGTVISLARKWTSNDTVPAQAAAFVNLQLGMFRFSHFHDRSTTIPVKQGIAFIEGQPINGRILSGGMWSNAVIDYSGRPVGEPFDRMSWYDYIKYYEVVPKVKSRSKQDAAAISEESGSDDESVDPPVIGSVSVPRKRGRAKRVTFPLGLHPKQSTHVVVKRKVDVMVTVSGARLKDEMKLNDLDSTDTDPPALFRDREDFAARVLVMFKPFRSMDDIRSVVDGNSYWRAYIRQRAVMLATDATMARYLHNSQSYYMDRGFEDQAALHEREEVDDPEMLKWRRQFRPDEEDGEADADSNEADDRSYMETQVEADADHGDPVVAVLRRAGMSVPNRAEHPTVVQASSLAAAMEVLADRKNVDPDRPVELVPVVVSDIVQPSRVIERVQSACENIDFESSSISGTTEPIGTAPVDRPSILEASRHFTLNQKQHYAFVLIASAVLMCLLRRIDPETLSILERNELRAVKDRVESIYSARGASRDDKRRSESIQGEDPTDDRERLFAFITGPAGAGKSRVISAVMDFARRWECSNSICLTATSGAAAALIGARTWHSATGLNISSNDDKLADHLPAVWSPIGMLIIDEIGMMGAASIVRLDRRLRRLKPESSDRRFGGIHVIGFGDLLQLKPVGDTEMFSSMSRAENIASRESMSIESKKRSRTSAFSAARQTASSSNSAAAAAAAAASSHDASSRPIASAVTADVYHTAYGLWRYDMNAGIELEENKRASADPMWADSLLRWAINRPTDDDIRLVNRCLISIEDEDSDFEYACQSLGNSVRSSRQSAAVSSSSDAAASTPRKLPAGGGGVQFIVVPTNVTRTAINQAKFRLYCSAHPLTAAQLLSARYPVNNTFGWRNRGCITVLGGLSIADKHGTLPADEKARLRQFVFTGVPGGKKKSPKSTPAAAAAATTTAADAKTESKNGADAKNGAGKAKTKAKAAKVDRGGDLWPGRLELIIGSQMMVLQNQQTQSGIVNGMMAELVDIVLTESAVVRFESRLLAAGTGGGVHTVDASDVSALILRYGDVKWRNKALFPSLPPGCFPLRAIRSMRSTKCRVKLYGERREVNVMMTQFPCSPAFAITGHKVQGQTLDQLIVGSWRPPTKNDDTENSVPEMKTIGANGYLYVLLSRVRSVSNLYILSPLPTDRSMYPARTSVMDELKRLREQVFEPTLRRLRAMDGMFGSDASAASASAPAPAPSASAALSSSSAAAAAASSVASSSSSAAAAAAPSVASSSASAAAAFVAPSVELKQYRYCRLCSEPIRPGQPCMGCATTIERQFAIRKRAHNKRKSPDSDPAPVPAAPAPQSPSTIPRTASVLAATEAGGWVCVLCHTGNRLTRRVCMKCKQASRDVSVL